MADNQEGTSKPQSTLSEMTEEQIAALPEPMQTQVRALLQRNKVLSAQVKEKDPSWLELSKTYGKDGKGTVGIKVSTSGAIQITGTRKAYGGLYIFKKEMQVLFKHQAAIQQWMVEHDAQLSNEKKPKVKEAEKAPSTEGEGEKEQGEANEPTNTEES